MSTPLRYAIERKAAGELREKLQIAEHLASFNQYIARLTQQIRDPASVVVSNLGSMAELLAAISPPPGRQPPDRAQMARPLAELVHLVERNQQNMERLKLVLSDLTALARDPDEETTLVQVNDLVQAACKMVSDELQDRAQLVLERGTLPLVAARRGMILRVFVNLLRNAVEALEPDGGGRITVASRHGGGAILVTVEDNGRGIPPALQGRVFTPFFSTGEGAGLGLSESLEMVLRHNGVLTFQSTEGQGSRFEVRLPDSAGTVARREPHTGHQRPRSARVLVIDDEPDVRESLERLLDFHHDVVAVSGGAEALELLRKDPHFDVILCDLMMRGIDGLVIYEEVDFFAPRLKDRIAFLSDGTMNDRIAYFSAAHPDRVFCKPVEGPELAQIISDILDGGQSQRAQGNTEKEHGPGGLDVI